MKNLSNENIVHIKKNGVEYLQFKKLLEYSNIINHAYSLGLDNNFKVLDGKTGIYKGEKLEKTINSYKKLSEAIGSNYSHIVKPIQMHTKEVKCVKNKTTFSKEHVLFKEFDNTDGLITNMPEEMLSTTNADCILLLFFDPIKKVIANTHSGWRGTVQRISVLTIEKMQKEYGCNPQDIICCICPSIRKCHFEVEKDVKDMFENEFKELTGFIEETIPNKKWHIDTVYINKEILKKAGLKPENIVDSNICSVCNCEQIHSYRVEGVGNGLSTALIEIKG